MSTVQPEAGRIAGVYEGYDTSPSVQTRRDPANHGNRAIEEERSRAMARLLRDAGLLPLGDRRVLDVGCGRGGVLAALLPLGARAELLRGVDLLPSRIEAARMAHPDLDFMVGDAQHLDLPDQSVDLALCFTLFSSVLDRDLQHAIASDIGRVLVPGGALLWYDMRYPNLANPQVRPVTRKRLYELFPRWDIRLRTVTLLPPLARRLGPLTAALFPVLASAPMLRSHYLGLLRPPHPLPDGRARNA